MTEELFVAAGRAPQRSRIATCFRGSSPVAADDRSDSFGLLQGDPRVWRAASSDLPRLPPAAFKEIIEGPTRLPGVGIAIEAEVTEQLIQDFEGADALPLLAFTLERLVTDHRANGRIEKRDYLDEMKGVGGAIRKAVEVAFAKAAEIPGLPRSRAAPARFAQRSFVPARPDRRCRSRAERRVALRRQLPKEALPLIDCLIDQRLLVADTAAAETDRRGLTRGCSSPLARTLSLDRGSA